MPKQKSNTLLESKLKPNQKLSCSGCSSIFESVISAAEHTIICKKKGMDGSHKKRKIEIKPQLNSKRFETSTTPFGSKRIIVSYHGSVHATPYLLKCIYEKANNFISKKNNDAHWQEIEAEVRKKFPALVASFCQSKWEKMKDDMNKHMRSIKNGTASQTAAKPMFFHVIREIERKMTAPSNEDEDSLLADPDAVEEEPFTAIMDSLGNMHSRDVLLDVAQSLEANGSASDESLSEKHKVELAIIEWVRENQEAVLKGSLKCSTCKKRILKRKMFVEHELDCASIVKESGKADEKVLTTRALFNKGKTTSFWSPENTLALIKEFKRMSPVYMTPQGTLRRGIWLQVYNNLICSYPGLTPQNCCEKWNLLVTQARIYSDFLQMKLEGKPLNGVTVCRPPYYGQIIAIEDIVHTSKNSAPFNIDPDDIKVEEETEVSMDGSDPSGNQKKRKDDYEDIDEEDEIGASAGEETDVVVFSDDENEVVARTNGEDKNLLSSDDEEMVAFEDSSEATSAESSEEERNETTEEDSVKVTATIQHMTQKVEALSKRLEKVEQENQRLRQEETAGSSLNLMNQVLGRLHRIIHNQNSIQTEQTQVMTKLLAVMERHHKENIIVMKDLVKEVAKSKKDSRV